MPSHLPDLKRPTMNHKPVILRDSKSALNLQSDEFQHKLLCDGIVLNLGDACAFSCEFCYVEQVERYLAPPLLNAHNAEHGTNLGFRDVVIRRRDVINTLKGQLLKKNGARRFSNPEDNRVVYSSTLVDVAANMDLLRETAEACNLILENTSWQIRLLSKSPLLRKLVEDELIPDRFRNRMIFGFSTGTVDEGVARAIEAGAGLVSKRLESLHWLQDRGFRTFAMICPSLPQEDYDLFSRDTMEAVRADRCEHVWAEVINLRGKSLARTLAALMKHGFEREAARLSAVCGAGSAEPWEAYARETFLAHARHCPPGKLRFLQYIDEKSASWWKEQCGKGAVLLGKEAKRLTLLANGPSAHAYAAPVEGVFVSQLDEEALAFRAGREEIVGLALKQSIRAAQALYEIRTYQDGILWKCDFPTFEAYCRDRWGYQKSQAYRLATCGEFIADLQACSPIGEWLPANESQVRNLVKLPRESRVEIWQEVAAALPADKRTAASIHREVKRLAVQKGIGSARARNPKNPCNAVERSLDVLRDAAANSPNGEKIRAVLAQIGQWLQAQPD